MSYLCHEPGSEDEGAFLEEIYERNRYHGGSVPDLSRFSSEARECVSWERRWRVCSRVLMFSALRSAIGG